jgi:hypothetical protein
MTTDQAITQIAVALDNIHHVLIHLTKIIEGSGTPISTPTSQQADMLSEFDPISKPDPDQSPAPVYGQPDPNNSAPTPGEFVDFTIDTVIHSIDDNGKPVYKGRGYPFTQYGVRIWPEIFTRLGIPIETIALGETTIEPRVVRAVLNETGNPRKIVGYGDEKTQVTSENNNNNNSAPPPPEPYPDRDIRPQPKDDEIPF